MGTRTVSHSPPQLFEQDIGVNMKQPFHKPKDTRAVAIRYAEGDDVPIIVAKGKGVAAENIIAKADETGVHTVADTDLVNELLRSDIADQIPQGLYTAVASVLIYINELDKKAHRSKPKRNT